MADLSWTTATELIEDEIPCFNVGSDFNLSFYEQASDSMRSNNKLEAVGYLFKFIHLLWIFH